MILNLRPPVALLRPYMIGEQADDALVREIASVVASVRRSILAPRVRSVRSVDSAAEFARLRVPTLYLRGMNDRLVPDSAFRTMAALREMESARVRGPHLLLQANPAVAGEAILPFIES
jgi:pimeloyl-[acyl-carrier protein] methyl ester esterase